MAIKSIVILKFKSFCKHCTLHGVYYFYKASSWSVYILWSMIIASSMVLCGFLGHMIWEKFVIDPTLTVMPVWRIIVCSSWLQWIIRQIRTSEEYTYVEYFADKFVAETTHYSMVNIPFPAVTVCDTESVYLPKTQEITELLLLRGYNMTEIQEFYKSFTDVKRKDYMPDPYIRKMHSLLEDIGYTLKFLLDTFKRPCNDMIVECSWRSRPHNCSDMFRPVFTIAGHCCQFDIPYFKRRADNQINFIAGVDSTEALDVIVEGQRKSVSENDSDGYPLLYVYDHKDKVTLIDSYISLTPESYFDVNIYVWAIDSSTNVKSLSLSGRKCILETDQGAGAGFHAGCMTRLILRRVVNRCRCLPFDYTSKELDVEDFSICSWDRLICIYQAIEMVQVDIKDIISQSECYQRCDYVQYDTEVEFIKNQRYLRMLNQSRSRVLVHFGQTTCMKYRREVLYTWDQMLANLGGIFGLCLGGSVISVIEIIWFLFDLLFTVLGSLCKKTIAPEKSLVNTDKNTVFIVSQNGMNSKKSSRKNIVGKYKFVN